MTNYQILEYKEETPDGFVVFRKFNDEEYTKEIGEIFKKNNIEYFISETTLPAPLLTNSEPITEFTIKLKRTDFDFAETVMMDVSTKQIDFLDKDYHLFQFTDDELLEVVSKSDEWSPLDLVLAQKLLKERGKEINVELSDKLKQERLTELAKPDKSEKFWIAMGYIFSFFGGILGIAIGWLLLSQKKTLPNGIRIYANSNNDRKHGNRIFLLGIFASIIWLIIAFYV